MFSGTSISTPATAISHPSSASVTQQAAPIDYEVCDATTGTHSAVASRIIDRAVMDNPRASQDSELVAALNSLRDMVSKTKEVPDTAESVRSRWYVPAGHNTASPCLNRSRRDRYVRPAFHAC